MFRRWVAAFTGLTIATQVMAGQQPMTPQQVKHFSKSEFTPVMSGYDNAPMLRTEITVDFRNASFRTVLREVSKEIGWKLLYDEILTTGPQRFTLQRNGVPAGTILREILAGTDIGMFVSEAGGFVVLKRWAGAGERQSAMTGIVIGRVTERGSGAPVPSAQVTVGAKAMRHTDVDGQYRIPDVSVGEQLLTVKRIGFETVSRRIAIVEGETITVDIIMDRSATTLTQVVTTATGERSRVEVGNNIGTIKVDSLVPTSLIRNMGDLLTARTPGVIVTNTSGMVGAPSLVRVRGTGSVSLSNDPIIVVDGIRIASASNAGRSVSAGGTTVAPAPGVSAYAGPVASRLDDIDPSTIESIDVLRGPSAASLYGPDAAAGVIVIKTKKGSTGPFRFSVMADQGSSHKPFPLPLQWASYGSTPSGVPISTCGNYHNGQTNYVEGTCTLDSIVAYDPLNNPRTTTVGVGTSRNLRGQLSGGTEQVREFLSVGTSDIVGMTKIPAYELDRVERAWADVPSWVRRPNAEQSMTGSSRTNARISSTLDLSLNVDGVYRNTLVGGPGGVQTSTGVSGVLATPYFDTLATLPAEGMRSREVTLAKRGYTSASANYMPASWLTMRATLGGDYTLRTDDALARASECTVLLAPATGCITGHRNTRGETFVTTADLNAQATWPVRPWVSLRTTLGEQTTRTKFYSLQAGNGGSTNLAFGTDLLSPAPVATTGTPQLYAVTESRDETAAAGWYLEETASIRERLYLTAAFRRDVASNFGPQTNANAPIYPKFSLSWVMTDEPFFPKRDWLTSFRLRTAYGHSGQSATQTAVLKNYATLSTYLDGAVLPGIRITSIGNPDLLPERTSEWEGGFDLSLYNERLHFEVTTYRKFSLDAIFTRTLPPSTTTGTAASQTINLGNVENRGWEFSGTGQLVDRRSFRWALTVNATWNDNKFVSAATSTDASWPRGAGNRVGYPLLSIFVHPITAYTDFNNDGVLRFDEVRFAPQFKYIGSVNPDGELTYTSVTDFLGGALRMNVVVDHIIGKSTGQAYRYGVSSGTSDKEHFVLTSIPAQAEWIQGDFGGQGALFNARKCYTLRLTELSVTGTLPPRLASRLLRARTTSLTLAGRNLMRSTNAAIPDPDVSNSFTDVSSVGFTGFNLPQPMEFTLRVNLGY